MAEGLARKLFGPSHQIQSAGSKSTHVSNHAIEVLREIDIDISKQESKSVDSIDPSKVDLVITLCEEEVCPAFLGKSKKLHWSLVDPARVPMTNSRQRLEEFRKTRDEIEKRLLKLSQELN